MNNFNHNIRDELIQLSEDGYIDKDYLLTSLIKYLSVNDLNDMAQLNEIPRSINEANSMIT